LADEDLNGDEAVDVVEEQATDTQPENTEPPTIDEIASRMGWAPQEEWRGDPAKWKPSHEFVATTADINTKLTSKLENVEKQLGTLARTSAAVTEQALAKQREELLAKREEAFESGDKQAFNQADQQLGQLERQPQLPKEPPETLEFRQRNPWMGQDPDATNYAANRAEQLAATGVGVKRQLEIVEREVKGMFPDLFPKQAKGAPLNQPGNRGGSVSRKGYSSLPTDAKAAADDYVKRGVFKDPEEYAKLDYEQEGV
jgi:hypothetical protein